MRKVKASTVKNCSAKCHTSDTANDDDAAGEYSIPLAELMQLAVLHRSYNIGWRIHWNIYIDANIAHKNDSDGEHQLFDDWSALSTRQKGSQSDNDHYDTDETPDPCRTTSRSKAAHYVEELQLFCR